MKLKEQVLSVCGDKYQCLESVKVNGTEVITIGTEEEPYVLNFEIGDTAISVNVIDKCEGVVIDEYEETALSLIPYGALQTWLQRVTSRPETGSESFSLFRL